MALPERGINVGQQQKTSPCRCPVVVYNNWSTTRSLQLSHPWTERTQCSALVKKALAILAAQGMDRGGNHGPVGDATGRRTPLRFKSEQHVVGTLLPLAAAVALHEAFEPHFGSCCQVSSRCGVAILATVTRSSEVPGWSTIPSEALGPLRRRAHQTQGTKASVIVYTPPCTSTAAKQTRENPNHKKNSRSHTCHQMPVPVKPYRKTPSDTNKKKTNSRHKQKKPPVGRRNAHYACDGGDVT